MKNPQGRETKKPKKSKVKTHAKVFEDTAHKIFQVPKSEIGDRPKES
jgi:hypothetical protein